MYKDLFSSSKRQEDIDLSLALCQTVNLSIYSYDLWLSKCWPYNHKHSNEHDLFKDHFKNSSKRQFKLNLVTLEQRGTKVPFSQMHKSDDFRKLINRKILMQCVLTKCFFLISC